jgi:hypothetical protein
MFWLVIEDAIGCTRPESGALDTKEPQHTRSVFVDGFALALAPATVSENNQLRLPTTNGLIEFSHALLSMA